MMRYIPAALMLLISLVWATWQPVGADEGQMPAVIPAYMSWEEECFVGLHLDMEDPAEWVDAEVYLLRQGTDLTGAMPVDADGYFWQMQRNHDDIREGLYAGALEWLPDTETAEGYQWLIAGITQPYVQQDGQGWLTYQRAEEWLLECAAATDSPDPADEMQSLTTALKALVEALQGLIEALEAMGYE